MATKEEPKPYVHSAYPSYRYHKELPPILVSSPEEDDFLDEDEWKHSPMDHGVITAPSQDQMQGVSQGFNFEQYKANKLAERAAAEADKEEKSSEEDVEESSGEESDEDQTDKPSKKKRR